MPSPVEESIQLAVSKVKRFKAIELKLHSGDVCNIQDGNTVNMRY